MYEELNKPKVVLLSNTKLSVAVIAMRTCWDSFNCSVEYKEPTDLISKKDFQLFDRIANKHKHESTIEHIVYSFRIQGITRAVLQELARHRIASYSVKSTRYTLKELKNADLDTEIGASKFIYLSNIKQIRDSSIQALKELKNCIDNVKKLDDVKPVVPECYKVDLVLTINARSLRNLLALRTSQHAYEEIRKLAFELFENLPLDHKFIYKDVVEENRYIHSKKNI